MQRDRNTAVIAVGAALLAIGAAGNAGLLACGGALLALGTSRRRRDRRR